MSCPFFTCIYSPSIYSLLDTFFTQTSPSWSSCMGIDLDPTLFPLLCSFVCGHVTKFRPMEYEWECHEQFLPAFLPWGRKTDAFHSCFLPIGLTVLASGAVDFNLEMSNQVLRMAKLTLQPLAIHPSLGCCRREKQVSILFEPLYL